LTPVFLPAAYAIWFKIKPANEGSKEQEAFAEAGWSVKTLLRPWTSLGRRLYAILDVD
jgi:hypothetical protein